MKRLTRLMPLLLVALVAGCGEKPGPEAEVRALVERLAEAAEASEAGPFRRAIAENYADLRGNERQDVITIVRGTLLRSRGTLLVFPDVQAVDLLTDSLVEADIRVRFAGADAARLALETAVYRFIVTFEQQDGDWLITSARWAEGDAEPR